MNWIGWLVLSIFLIIILYLLVIPYVILNFWWGISITIFFYLYMNFLFWISIKDEMSYGRTLLIPFYNFWHWITNKK